ncbi:MAG: calcium/sodium antiporter [Anaerolineales bacterium]|nr:calcium/sodium antiporter [Anaerolineales bacterium]
MDWTMILMLLGGLAALTLGAEVLVRGAARLAAALGISPLVIGLTVVAFGTSSPELAVSVQAAWSGEAGADIAIGNVVGSNIFNVLLILGLSAVVAPLIVSQQLVRVDVPIMIGVSLLFALMASDGKVDRLDGLLLFSGLIAYTAFAIHQGRKESKAVEDEYAQEFGEKPRGTGQIMLNLAFVVGGLVMLTLGSNWFVDGAIALARAFGVSELVIGLTIVAGGTSLPEVATSVMASLKGERDIAVGNVVGSNIFNLLSVLGLAALVAPDGVNVASAAFDFDIPVMIAVAVACLPIFFTGYTIARWEGFVFLGYYVAYTTYLLLAASQHDALPMFSNVMLYFVIPLTALTIGVTVFRSWRAGRARSVMS